jgi:hypothetical protein
VNQYNNEISSEELCEQKYVNHNYQQDTTQIVIESFPTSSSSFLPDQSNESIVNKNREANTEETRQEGTENTNQNSSSSSSPSTISSSSSNSSSSPSPVQIKENENNSSHYNNKNLRLGSSILNSKLVKLNLYAPPNISALNASFNQHQNSANQYSNQNNILTIIGTNSLMPKSLDSNTLKNMKQNNTPSVRHQRQSNLASDFQVLNMSAINGTLAQPRPPRYLSSAARIMSAKNNPNHKSLQNTDAAQIPLTSKISDFAIPSSLASTSPNSYNSNNGNNNKQQIYNNSRIGSSKLVFLKSDDTLSLTEKNNPTSFFNNRSHTFTNFNQNNKETNNKDLTQNSINQLLALKDLDQYIENSKIKCKIGNQQQQQNNITKLNLKTHNTTPILMMNDSDFRRTNSALPILRNNFNLNTSPKSTNYGNQLGPITAIRLVNAPPPIFTRAKTSAVMSSSPSVLEHNSNNHKQQQKIQGGSIDKTSL